MHHHHHILSNFIILSCDTQKKEVIRQIHKTSNVVALRQIK